MITPTSDIVKTNDNLAGWMKFNMLLSQANICINFINR